jgi:ribonuclease PH
MTRSENRSPDSLRSVRIEKDIQPQADGSVLIKMGNTHVICGVSVEERVPPFLQDAAQGWITAEYGVLPCATGSRYRRETAGQSGRTMEIQRLIGRSLRTMVDLRQLGERTFRVDCDVLNADGGTRTASITGAAIALGDAIRRTCERGLLEKIPQVMPVAAVSAGIVDGVPMLDLDYREDSAAEVDANFVMSGDGRWIEIQATAEGKTFSGESYLELMRLAEKGIQELLHGWS